MLLGVGVFTGGLKLVLMRVCVCVCVGGCPDFLPIALAQGRVAELSPARRNRPLTYYLRRPARQRRSVRSQKVSPME